MFDGADGVAQVFQEGFRNPEGPLSIFFDDKELKQLLDGSSSGGGCGKYSAYTEVEKAKIAMRAAEMCVRHFQKEFSEHPLKESAVRTWVNACV